jgi:hypothetical protein
MHRLEACLDRGTNHELIVWVECSELSRECVFRVTSVAGPARAPLVASRLDRPLAILSTPQQLSLRYAAFFCLASVNTARLLALRAFAFSVSKISLSALGTKRANTSRIRGW